MVPRGDWKKSSLVEESNLLSIRWSPLLQSEASPSWKLFFLESKVNAISYRKLESFKYLLCDLQGHCKKMTIDVSISIIFAK